MLSPVKIYDKHGKLKATVTKEEIEDRHWKRLKTNNQIFAVKGSKPDTSLLLRSVKCNICGTSFDTTHRKTKYCDKICADKAVKRKKKGLPIKNETEDKN